MAPVHLDLSLYPGPSLLAPHAAVVAEFVLPAQAVPAADALQARLVARLPQDFRARLALPPGALSFPGLAACCAQAFNDPRGEDGLGVVAAEAATPAQCRLIAAYDDARAARHALRSGVALALRLCAPAGDVDLGSFVSEADRVVALLRPDGLTRAFARAAARRGIPVYPLAVGTRTRLYGQGRLGFHGSGTASQYDATTGVRLSNDKYLSNQLVTALGLPGVEHRLTHDLEGALAAARELGYPLVVKPVEGGKGAGVTAAIGDELRLRAAFEQARQRATRGVLIERHVAGDDHRLAVVGGRLAWVVRRIAPSVIGDGENSVAALIEAANADRDEGAVASGFFARIGLDDDLLAVLARQGLTPGEIPPAGARVALRDIANVATGATIEDLSATIHPDNRALAETLARGFRIDTLGIDFVTTDIARSWREGGGAVIEVNAAPGFSSDARAELILAHRFAPGCDGRVPSVLVVDEDMTLPPLLVAALRTPDGEVGCTDGVLTQLGDASRCAPGASLHQRVTALLLDPSCTALVVRAAARELVADGLPLDRFDAVALAAGHVVEAPLRELLCAHARAVLDGVTAGTVASRVLAVLAAKRGAR